jgi:hypothetical protein
MQSKLKAALQGGALILVGSLQMVGNITGSPTVKAMGAISHAAPAPKVFTTQNGYETYSPRFYLNAIDDLGTVTSVQLTPKINARVSGPYNRRNAYGAALSYGPVLASQDLTRPMFESAFEYAFCTNPDVISEIGLPKTRRYQVNIEPRDPHIEVTWPTRFAIDCDARSITIHHTQTHSGTQI